MSGRLSGSSESSLDADDLLEMRERFKELTKQKEMLRDSKSQSFDLIRKLELHAKTLSESHEKDKKRIMDLERELSNCSQEIDYLQDQLNMRDSDLNLLGEQVCSLQLKLSDMENLLEEVNRLRKQLNLSESEKSLLLQEIEDKEDLIKYSESRIEKLEESVSSMGLDYQCEIESTKLESISLEQNLYETKKLLEDRTQENSRMNELIQDLEIRIGDAGRVIKGLENENDELKKKLQTSDMHTKTFAREVEEQLHHWLGKHDNQSFIEMDKDVSMYGDVLGPLFSKIAIHRAASNADLSDKVAEMSCQINDYEHLVKQLKQELREEKMKSKEEAEDLAQEMAELRYQLTNMLDEECKRRANVEQLSLQRIAELEAQIAKERQKSIGPLDLVLRNQ